MKNWVIEPKVLEQINIARLKECPKRCQLNIRKENDLINFFVSGIYSTIETRQIDRKTPYLKYKIASTAVTIFKRFYLKNQIAKKYMEFYPIQIMVISIYLAMKIEECPLSVIAIISNQLQAKQKFGGIIHYGHPAYLEMELAVAQNIGYDLDIPSIFRPLESLFHIIKQSKLIDSVVLLKMEEDMLQKIVLPVFFDQILFQYPLGLLALVIINMTLSKYKKKFAEFLVNQPEIVKTIEKNKDKLNEIKIKIQNIQFDENNQETAEIRKQLDTARNFFMNKNKHANNTNTNNNNNNQNNAQMSNNLNNNSSQDQGFKVPQLKRRESSRKSSQEHHHHHGHSSNNDNNDNGENPQKKIKRD